MMNSYSERLKRVEKFHQSLKGAWWLHEEDAVNNEQNTQRDAKPAPIIVTPEPTEADSGTTMEPQG